MGQNPVFTIPPNSLNCDILMIGGGAGACFVAINKTLPEGSCVVYVGNGGGQYTNGGIVQYLLEEI